MVSDIERPPPPFQNLCIRPCDCLLNFIINERLMARLYVWFILEASLSKTFVQVVKNASNPFSLRILPCTISSCLKKIHYESL